MASAATAAKLLANTVLKKPGGRAPPKHVGWRARAASIEPALSREELAEIAVEVVVHRSSPWLIVVRNVSVLCAHE